MNNGIKRNKKERLEKLRKLKKVTFIISLVLNGLFTLLVIIGLCLPKASNTANNNRPQKALRQTNNAINDFISNSNCLGYDLNEPYSENKDKLSYSNQTFTYFNVLNNFIFWGNTGETHSVDNLKITLDIHYPFINFDSITIDCLNLSNQSVYKRYYQYIDGRFEANSTGSLYDTQTFAVAINNNYNGDYQEVNTLFASLFPPLNYYDIHLAENWNIHTLFGDGVFFIGAQTSQTLTIVNNAVFSVNGQFFTTIKVRIEADHDRVVAKDSSGVYTAYEYQQGYGFISFVMFENNLTGRQLIVMSLETNIGTSENSGYIKDSLHFINSNYQYVRLFDYNLRTSCTSPRPISYYDLFFMNNSIGQNGGSYGEIGDVFGLFTQTFSGLTGLFSIKVLNGITIGMLLFLPLVGIIIFAIIKIIKK